MQHVEQAAHCKLCSINTGQVRAIMTTNIQSAVQTAVCAGGVLCSPEGGTVETWTEPESGLKDPADQTEALL